MTHKRNLLHIATYCTPGLIRELEDYCNKVELTKSQVLRIALEKYLEQVTKRNNIKAS